MTITCRIELSGVVVPKKRHRQRQQTTKDAAGRITGFRSQPYPDKRSVDYEHNLRAAAQLAWDQQNPGLPRPVHLPCEVLVDVYVQAPQNPQISAEMAAALGLDVVSGKKIRQLMLDGVIRPRRPDADNVLKTVMDALNRGLWADDAGCVAAGVRKWYAVDPRLTVELEVQTYRAEHVARLDPVDRVADLFADPTEGRRMV